MAVPIASPNIHPRKRSSLDISRDTPSSVGLLARLLGLILSGSVLDRETVLVAFVGVSIRSGEEGERGEFDGISLGITTLSVSRRKFDVDELRTEGGVEEYGGGEGSFSDAERTATNAGVDSPAAESSIIEAK